MTVSDHATQQFAPQAASAGAARRFLRDTLTAWGAHEIVDDALLITNELVTNAVVHAGTDLSVSCALAADHVRITVADEHASRTLPVSISGAAAESTSGRGLFLLAELAPTWGVEYAEGSKRVWFRLPLARGAPSETPQSPPAQFVDLGPDSGPVRVAVVATDADGLVTDWSPEATRMLGWTSEAVVGRPLADLVDSIAGDVAGTATDVLARPRWSGDVRLRNTDGTHTALFGCQTHVVVGERPATVVLLVAPEHRALLPWAQSPGPADEVMPVPARPGLMPLDTLLALAVDHSRDLLQGDAGYVLLVTDDDLEVELRAASGLSATAAARPRWPKPPELGDGAEGRRPHVYADLAAADVPERFLTESGLRGLVTAPLLVGDRVIGRIGVATRESDRLSAEDGDRLKRSINRFSLAVESARLNELDRLRRGRLSYLAEASELLAGMLDPDMTAAMTAQLVVPRIADWCAVYVTDTRRALRLSCVWHAREDRIDSLKRLLTGVPAPPLDESGRPHQWQALREHLAARTADPADVEIAGGPTVSVTMMARGRPIGTLIAGRSAGTEFVTGVLDTLDDLGRRASAALDSARLYRDRSTISDALQRSLLPRRLPHVPFLEVGVAYEAAGEGLDVGGDFYDLFEIDARRWGFVVGDVCGKGPEAAAMTGLARHSLRLLAREHNDVAAVLRRLNATLLADSEPTRFVTLVYGELEATPGGATVTFVSAGHPLPALVGPGDVVRPVGSPQPLLGVFPELTYRVETLPVMRGQHLVCTTDGATDRRVGSHTLGDSGLRTLLRSTAMLPASAVASRIRQGVLDFSPAPLQDDIAVLVLQPVTPAL